jgi:hypothetical protein
MKNIEGKMAGILGTVIIHLVAAILFMSFQMRNLKIDRSDEFLVEFAQVEEPPSGEKQIKLPASRIENILQGDEELLNIARNLANKPEEQINPADYIDKVKEELIKDGKLSSDNYIDEQKRQDELNGEEKLSFEDKSTSPNDDESVKESQVMAANYQGPTRIYYNLVGRNHTYLPIPIYKCQGSGKVVLNIKVNQKGIVEDAQVIEEESTTADPCLAETAVKTALISRFNPDINSAKIQIGTMTYLFVAQ